MKEEVHVPGTPTPRLAPSRVRRVSWGAIFSGMFVTIVIQVMLTLLGVAVGLTQFPPGQHGTSTQTMGRAAGIWLLVSGLLSIWIGSCVAGRLSGGPRRTDGLLHGIVTWSVSTLAMFLLLATTIGSIVGGVGSFLSSAMSGGGPGGGGQNAATAMAGQIKQLVPQAGALLPPTGRTEGQQQPPGTLTALSQQDPELGAALARMESHGGASQSQGDRDQVINLLTSKHNMDQQQAANLVNQWDQQFQQARAQAGQKAQEVGTEAAHGASQAALWGFIALILGLAVSAWGGWAGTASLPRPTEAATVTT